MSKGTALVSQRSGGLALPCRPAGGFVLVALLYTELSPKVPAGARALRDVQHLTLSLQHWQYDFPLALPVVYERVNVHRRRGEAISQSESA
jgi:hypothetical protein